MTVSSLPSRPGLLILDPQAPPNGRRVYVCEPFRLFFCADGGKNAPADATDSDRDGIADYVGEILKKLLIAYDVYVNVIHLPDFRLTGYLHREGVRYVDVMLDDIPIQRGLMSSVVTNNEPDFLRGSGHSGPSVVLRLHRALPKSSLTPAHELFHLFQYASLPFLNMWFMEGLARHGQRWMADKRAQSFPLPQTQGEVEALLQQWHDAEGFWNRLAELCGDPVGSGVETADGKTRVDVGNPFMIGQRFLGCFFRHALSQLQKLCVEMPGRNLTLTEPWPTAERRSGANNRFILRAVCATLRELAPPAQAEAETFISVVKVMDQLRLSRDRTQEVQRFLGTLERHGLASVRTAPDGSLQCDGYDAATATLSLPEIVFAAGQLTDAELDSFVVVRHLIGKMALKDQPNLARLDGLANLTATEGDLSIEKTGVTSLVKVFPALKRIKGHLHILDNPNLQTLTGFDRLNVIDGELVISGNQKLKKLVAFAELKEIKKGDLSIRRSTQLETIQGFNNLQSIRGLFLEHLAIRHIDFLRRLFAEQPDFPGPIRIVNCRLAHIRALAGLRTVASSLYLHGNEITELYPLYQLTRVGASFSLSNNRIQYLHPLNNLAEVNGMLGLMNNQLENLDGLESLRYLKTVKWNNESRTLMLRNNSKLCSLEALANVVVKEPVIIDINVWDSYVLPLGGAAFYDNSFVVQSTGEGSTAASVLCSTKTQSMTRNLRSRRNLNAYTAEFNDLDEVISICNSRHLSAIFPTTLSAIRFVHRNESALRKVGLGFIVPSSEVLKKLSNKDVFYNSMETNAFKEYIPKIYRNLKEMDFPCIKKSNTNSGGKGQQKINSIHDVNDDFSKFVYSEYISGALEYASNILMVAGKIVYSQTFEKYTTDEFYILGTGDHNYSNVKSRPVATEFYDIFQSILSAFDCEGFYCIDYKKIDNVPKIFEINARIGLTNGLFPALLERSIGAYCTQVEKSLHSVPVVKPF